MDDSTRAVLRLCADALRRVGLRALANQAQAHADTQCGTVACPRDLAQDLRALVLEVRAENAWRSESTAANARFLADLDGYADELARLLK